MKNLSYLILFSMLILSSCKKEDEVELIPNNIAPPDETIEQVTLSNYVNKLYIGILGRKATDSENTAGLKIITDGNASIASRTELVNLVLANSEYYTNEFYKMRADYLDGADSADMQQVVETFTFALTTTTNELYKEFFQTAIDGIEPLMSLEDDLKNGQKNTIEAHKIIVNNYIYDELNMGSENFIVSLFQNFLLRYPTTSELESGKNIVDGASDIIFLTTANSKSELIDIFFNSTSYFEGQVRINFLRFLYREPTASEVSTLTSLYISNKDYKALQTYILTTDEYLGIE